MGSTNLTDRIRMEVIMSATYGYLTGNRGTATRCGSRLSGIAAILKTWRSRCSCHLSSDDELTIEAPSNVRVILNGCCVQSGSKHS